MPALKAWAAPRQFMHSTALVTSKNALWWLLTATFLSRLLFALLVWHLNGSQGFLSPDAASYVTMAQSLLKRSFSFGGVPEIVRTPGYPVLLLPAVVSRHQLLTALLENFLLATVSAWLVWKIATELVPHRAAAWWAVLLYCFEPVGFIYSEKLLSDVLFATQLLLFVWLSVRYFRNPTAVRLIGSALALGMATYTRPVSLYLGLWFVPLFLLFPRRLTWTQHLPRTIAFVLLFALTLVPWVIRNAKIAGYTGFSATPDVNLYFSSGAAVKARVEHKSLALTLRELGYGDEDLYLQAHPEQRNWPQARIFQFQRAEGRRIISQHWLEFFLIHLHGCAIVLLDPAATAAMKLLRLYPESGGLRNLAADQGLFRSILWLIGQYPIAALALPLLGIQLGLYYFLALTGGRWLPLEVGALFVFFIFYFVLISGGPIGDARFRAPVMPLVCIAAGVAMARWYGSCEQSDRPQQLQC